MGIVSLRDFSSFRPFSDAVAALTIQTCAGFLLTTVTIRLVPEIQSHIGLDSRLRLPYDRESFEIATLAKITERSMKNPMRHGMLVLFGLCLTVGQADAAGETRVLWPADQAECFATSSNKGRIVG